LAASEIRGCKTSASRGLGHRCQADGSAVDGDHARVAKQRCLPGQCRAQLVPTALVQSTAAAYRAGVPGVGECSTGAVICIQYVCLAGWSSHFRYARHSLHSLCVAGARLRATGADLSARVVQRDRRAGPREALVALPLCKACVRCARWRTPRARCSACWKTGASRPLASHRTRCTSATTWRMAHAFASLRSCQVQAAPEGTEIGTRTSSLARPLPLA
jgi:hypothetical protein